MQAVLWHSLVPSGDARALSQGGQVNRPLGPGDCKTLAVVIAVASFLCLRERQYKLLGRVGDFT